MPRMQILNSQEREAFDSPPRFNSVERKQFFDVTPKVESLIASMRTPINAVCFVVALGYFKATKRFFGLQLQDEDVQYVASRLGYLPEMMDKDDYDKTTAGRHQKMILEYQGYKEFDEVTRAELTKEIRSMATSQSKPTFMFFQALEILERGKVEIPNSWTLNELILDEIKQHKRELTATIDEHLSQTTRDFLDGLLEVPSDDELEERLEKARLALLKRISQSTKPSKIKGTVDDFRTIRDLYRDVEPVINLLNLTPEGIRFYAEAVIRYNVFQVARRADDDRHLHLVCFAAHQCFRLQDTLVDILLKAVQNTSGTCQREHKEIYYEGRKERRDNVRRFLKRVDDGAFTPLADIESIAFDGELQDSDKVQRIQAVFAAAKERRDSATENLEGLRTALEPHAADAEYYRALESKSLKLQNRVSEIVKAVDFHGNDEPLMSAIIHYKEKDGAITASAPSEFLDEDERQFDWYGRVFSSAEKEAHYVIDGLMHNDVVKSDIHSTDTDGYSEVVFGVTHLLGFSFAPRLKNLKTKTIYSFPEHPRKTYQEQGFRILPAKYINVKLIAKHWDDILRFVATIKLKHATASQLFRRLNSYSTQHPLYAALKEYGRILKSDFILRYIDILAFRQAIEKQLNKGENSNKFSKAISFGNNHEFLHGEQVEQEIADGCRRLIKNSIVCWNYLYATHLIANEPNPVRRKELIEQFTRVSMAAWKHLNLHGEYDFSEAKMTDSVGLELTPKILELSVV